MAKKQKKNLQKLLAKRRQLQQIESGTITLPNIAALPNQTLPEIAPVPTRTQLTAPTHSRELLRTLFSIVLIAGVLVAVIIFDKQRPDLKNFGDWLYSALKLKA